MAQSQAAQQVKLGFWVGAGFLAFGVVVSIVCILILKAMGSK